MSYDKVDQLSLCCMKAELKVNGIKLGPATAFLVSVVGQTFLVTNWHVVSGRDANTGDCLDKQYAAIPDTLSVMWHSPGVLGYCDVVDIPLYNNDGLPLWLEHESGRQVDVVVIPCNTKRLLSFPFPIELEDSPIKIHPGSPVCIVGYPLGLSVSGILPIWKTGHMACDFYVNFNPGSPAFLIDATTKEGMSGSPVFARVYGPFETEEGYLLAAEGVTSKFLGVYAGREGERSDIGRVWRSSVIKEIINYNSRRVLSGIPQVVI